MDVLLTMRAFRRVVERNSFYKAAEDLAITPAALSKQIKQLESRLGTLLLVRTTRSMSLTEAGQLYYQEACRLLGEFDALEQTVAASAQQVSGTLRVNAPLSFGLTVLSPLLPPFMQRYPQLQVELTLDDRVLDVVAAGFDISLRIRRRLPDSSLSARALGDVHQRICAAPGFDAGDQPLLQQFRQMRAGGGRGNLDRRAELGGGVGAPVHQQAQHARPGAVGDGGAQRR